MTGKKRTGNWQFILARCRSLMRIFRDDRGRIAWFSKFEEEMDMKKCVKAIPLNTFFEGEPGNGE